MADTSILNYSMSLRQLGNFKDIVTFTVFKSFVPPKIWKKFSPIPSLQNWFPYLLYLKFHFTFCSLNLNNCLLCIYHWENRVSTKSGKSGEKSGNSIFPQKVREFRWNSGKSRGSFLRAANFKIKLQKLNKFQSFWDLRR